MQSHVVLSVESTQEKTTSIVVYISSGCPNNLKQQEWILAQFQKLEVHNPDASRVVLPKHIYTQRKDKANQRDERETLKNSDNNILPQKI